MPASCTADPQYNFIICTYPMATTYIAAPFFQISRVSIILIWPLWRIFRKAGFAGVLALLFLIPIVDVLLIFYLALPSGLPCATIGTMTTEDKYMLYNIEVSSRVLTCDCPQTGATPQRPTPVGSDHVQGCAPRYRS